jgi:hypothetical protein
VSNNGISDTIVIKLRKKEIDSLKVSRQTIGVLDYKDTLFLSTNNPIIKIDTTKINFIDTDTINILYTPYISKKENKIGFIFQKKFKKTYKLNLYPNALTDIFNTSNDTIISQFKTRSLEDYGEITLDVKNTKMTPIIVQLTDLNDKTIAQETTSVSKNISFKYLTPNKYKIRIIYDTNNNGKWDTGNYLAKKQPELVEYLPEIQEVRANWQVPIVLNIKEL